MYELYEEWLKDVSGIMVHPQPTTGEYESNYWLCTITIDPEMKVKGQENAYKTIVTSAVWQFCSYLFWPRWGTDVMSLAGVKVD